MINPSEEQIEYYLDKWNKSERNKSQEISLYKLFHETYPFNNDIDDVLIKVSTLNDFYSTNIYDTFSVAKHIVDLNIDEKLIKVDIDLVKDISKVKLKTGEKCFYSFATKYCSHHNDSEFPIYDSYVEKVLVYLEKQDKFAGFKRIDLRDYKRFKEILVQFREFYGLEKYSLKDIDKYLWLLGKDEFNKY